MFFSKKPDLMATIEMDGGLAYVEFSGETTPANLIKLAIHYLGRYFYICDDRQFLPMKEILQNYSKEKKLDYQAFERLMASIESMVFETFNEKEREALAAYIRVNHSLPFIPNTSKLEKTQFKYIFKLFIGPEKSTNNLKMSLMLDKQILPRSVAFIMFYVSEKLDKKNQDKLAKSIGVFLNELGANRKEVDLLIGQRPQIEALKGV